MLKVSILSFSPTPLDCRAMILSKWNINRLVLNLFFPLNLFLLFLSVLGLHCCAGFSLVGTSGRYSSVVVLGLLNAAASPVAERRF